MDLRFVGQPFAAQPNLVDFISHARDEGFDELTIAVAWAKRSGLGRIWDALVEFRDNGGVITLIVGVSEGGATREGLELALEVADHGYVFHDPRRTFHPKVYFASSLGKRSLMVGSSNLTAGGLSWNYEASLWVDWEAGEGEAVTDEVVAWFETLMNATGSCSPLTIDLIDQLQRSGDILLGSEKRARRVRRTKTETPEDNDSAIAATISGLFQPMLVGLRRLPGLSTVFSPATSIVPPAVGSVDQVRGPSRTPKAPALAGAAPFSTADVRRRWFKRLDHSAAQQVKSLSSNPTGNLRLSREDAAVDHKTYFREDFFGGLPWAPTDGKASEQEVLVEFHTWIDGDDLGWVELRLSHDRRRISNQGNVPTVLHWGGLAKLLRGTNYVGLFVSIELTERGKYNLVISEAPRGPYQV